MQRGLAEEATVKDSLTVQIEGERPCTSADLAADQPCAERWTYRRRGDLAGSAIDQQAEHRDVAEPAQRLRSPPIVLQPPARAIAPPPHLAAKRVAFPAALRSA